MHENQGLPLSELRTLAQQRGWRVTPGKPIPHGLQVVVDNGVHKTILNFFDSGKIVIQGRESPLKEELSRWIEFIRLKRDSLPERPNEPAPSSGRVTKYHVHHDQIDKIRSLIFSFPGLQAKNTTGASELYRVEVYQGQEKVTITQYKSGTLLIQGSSNQLFDNICDVLDQHLNQPFVDRAIRYLPHEDQRLAAAQYLEHPEAENTALQWLHDNLENGLLDFIHQKDRQTLVSAAGIRNYCKNRKMPDYSPMVMPFGKALEGFILKLADFLNIPRNADGELRISELINKVALTISQKIGSKQAKDVQMALTAAWESRNKAMHSNPAHALSTLPTFTQADQEVTTIIRGMNRAYIILVQTNSVRDGSNPNGSNNSNNSDSNSSQKSKNPHIESNKDKGLIYDNVDREYLLQKLKKDGYEVILQPEGRKNEWEIKESDFNLFAPRNVPGRIVIKGPKASIFVEKYKNILNMKGQPRAVRIGVDESGKGDVFGPLVVAAVAVTNDVESTLLSHGVRDSKTLSKARIYELAQLIKSLCFVEVLVLQPPDYNLAYEKHGRNLNRLLAWGHTQVISRLEQRTQAIEIISDQFGDPSLLLEYVKGSNISVPVLQRPHAESDVAVAAASIVARAEFLSAIAAFSTQLGMEVPLGASEEAKQAVKKIYRQQGMNVLRNIAKLHFRTVTEVLGGVSNG